MKTVSLLGSNITILLTTVGMGQCPNTSSPHFSCTSAGGNTQITLFQDAELAWDSFDLAPDSQLNIASEGGLGFQSRHRVSGPAIIGGRVRADGPLIFSSSGSLTVGPGGRVTAPAVTLSSLQEIAPGQFVPRRRRSADRLTIAGRVEALDGSLNLAGGQVRIEDGGSVIAEGGKVRLVSSEKQIVQGPDFTLVIDPDAPISRTGIQQNGEILAPAVEIYSEGFLQNSGQIRAIGPDGQIILRSRGEIVHDDRPGSVLEAANLDTGENAILRGAVVNPNDGNNPGGVSTTVGFPDLQAGSFSGRRTTQLLPAQYSSSTIGTSQIPSAVAKRQQKAATAVASRGAKAKAKKKRARKVSFFGTVTTK